MCTIVLIRHGEPKIDWPDGLNWREFKCWTMEYRDSVLTDLTHPSDSLRREIHALKPSTWISSELNRSKQSLQRLGATHSGIVLSELNEVTLPTFPLPIVRLSAWNWVVFLATLSRYGYTVGSETSSKRKKRASTAVDLVLDALSANEVGVVVGHGLVNELIATEFQRRAFTLVKEEICEYWRWQRFELCLS